MLKDTEWCADPECGCRTTVYPSREKCPNCGEQLRFSGHSQQVNFRLTCRHCGYHSPRLSQETLHELL